MSDADLEATAARDFDSAEFRTVMGHFATGIAIITAAHAEGPVGLTVQSFTSLSLDPPLVCFAPAKSSSSYPRIKAAGAFCVNILGEHQEALCRVFAQSGADKFAGVGYDLAPTSRAPRLHDTLAWVDCTLEAEHDAGDHLVVIGRVSDMGVADEGRPLLFYRGGYGRLEA